MKLAWDHPAQPGCYYRVRGEVGEICVLCYYHVLSFTKVRVTKHGDVAVCQECGNVLARRGVFRPTIVRLLMDLMLRRLAFDNVTARGREMIENYEIDEHTVVH